jgi:hypothetical protein
MHGLGICLSFYVCSYDYRSDSLIMYNNVQCELYFRLLYHCAVHILVLSKTSCNMPFFSTDCFLLPDMSLSVLTVEKYIEVASIGMAIRIQKMQQYEQRFSMSGLV